jgi:hypothetical protein
VAANLISSHEKTSSPMYDIRCWWRISMIFRSFSSRKYDWRTSLGKPNQIPKAHTRLKAPSMM